MSRNHARAADLDPRRLALVPRIKEEPLARPHIFGGDVKFLRHGRRKASLDFDGNGFLARRSQEQINFRAGGCAIKVSFDFRRDGVQDILNHEAFPTGSDDGMAEQRFAVSDAQQLVEQPAVSHINFRGAHEPFPNVPMPRVESAAEQHFSYKILINLATPVMRIPSDS